MTTEIIRTEKISKQYEDVLAVPGLFGMPSGAEGMQLNIASYLILMCTCLSGFFGTIAVWRYADQK